MLRITCPHCGVRDEVEFRYRGDASVRRPPADADATAALGFALCRSGSKDEGTRYLKQALELDPSFELVAQTLASERQ